MPDTRLPDTWLGAPQFDGISDAAWRILTFGYMWSNRYLTDGRIPLKSLRHLGTNADDEALNELIELGLIGFDSEAIQLDWRAQTTKEVFLKAREATRIRVANYRAKEANESNTVTNSIPNGVSRTGEARRGEARNQELTTVIAYGYDPDETF